MKINTTIKTISLSCLLLSAGTLLADQHETTGSEQQPEVQAPAPQQTTTTQENITPADSFVPTETISEDLSVPFPVDI